MLFAGAESFEASKPSASYKSGEKSSRSGRLTSRGFTNSTLMESFGLWNIDLGLAPACMTVCALGWSTSLELSAVDVGRDQWAYEPPPAVFLVLGADPSLDLLCSFWILKPFFPAPLNSPPKVTICPFSDRSLRLLFRLLVIETSPLLLAHDNVVKLLHMSSTVPKCRSSYSRPSMISYSSLVSVVDAPSRYSLRATCLALPEPILPLACEDLREGYCLQSEPGLRD